MWTFPPDDNGLRAYDLASLVKLAETRWSNSTDFIKMILLYTRKRSGLFSDTRTEQGLHVWSSVFFFYIYLVLQTFINPLTPNDPYRGRTAPLTSKRCILYIYSTNMGNEYFKRGIYSVFSSLQNAVCFIILTYLVPVLFTFYIQDVLKLKKNSGAERLISW